MGSLSNPRLDSSLPKAASENKIQLDQSATGQWAMMHRSWFELDLRPAAFKTLWCIALRANTSGVAYFTVKQLLSETGFSDDRHLRRQLKRLQQVGVLAHRQRSKEYTLLQPDPAGQPTLRLVKGERKSRPRSGSNQPALPGQFDPVKGLLPGQFDPVHTNNPTVKQTYTTAGDDAAANFSKDQNNRTELLKKLHSLGVPSATAEDLVQRHPLERIADVLELRKFRTAGNRVGFLVAALRSPAPWVDAAPASAAWNDRHRYEAAAKRAETERQEAALQAEAARAERERLLEKLAVAPQLDRSARDIFARAHHNLTPDAGRGQWTFTVIARDVLVNPSTSHCSCRAFDCADRKHGGPDDQAKFQK